MGDSFALGGEENAHDEVRMLLPHVWRLLLESFESRLPPSSVSRRLLRRLSSFGPAWVSSLVGVLERNALPASAPASQPDEPSLEAMVFVPAGAMVNHSCVPNCSVSFNGKRTGAAVGGAEDAADGASWDGWGHVSLLTLRDIDAEEELTISYVDAQMTLRERSAALKAMHGFTCRCEKCEVQRGALKLRRATRLLSLTIALNGTSEYTGGGTSFEAPLTKDPDEGERHVVRPELGHVVAFPGAMRHGGQRVTTGVRYIIAAFLYVSQEPA